MITKSKSDFMVLLTESNMQVCSTVCSFLSTQKDRERIHYSTCFLPTCSTTTLRKVTTRMMSPLLFSIRRRRKTMVSLKSLSSLGSPSTSRNPSPIRRVLYTIEEEDEEEAAAPLRSPSPARSHFLINDFVAGQRYGVGFVRILVQSRSMRRRKKEDYN